MEKKRLCVVGCGRWGMNHVRTLYRLGILFAVVDSDEQRLKSISEEYADVTCHMSLEEAIHARYDGYTVAVPAEAHYSIGSQLLKAGLSVMMEKPMTLTVAESESLIALSNEYGGRLMVGHVLMFHPAIRKIKEVIESGKIGELRYIYSHRLNLGTIRTEEDVFWSFAPHDISLLDYLTGTRVVAIRAKGSDYLTKGVSDIVIAELDYPNNVHAHIFTSWLNPFKQQQLVIIGSEGMLTFDDAGDKEIKYFAKGVNFDIGRPQVYDNGTEVIPYEISQPLTAELAYFAEHCDGDITINSGEDGLAVVRVLEQVSTEINNSN